MTIRKLSISLRKPFGNLRYRSQTVLIAVVTQQGKVILGGKSAYPPGIFRLIGGGLEPGETPVQAAKRELNEELKIVVNPQRLTELFEVDVAATDDEGKRYRLKVYVLSIQLNEGELAKAGDDVDYVKEFSLDELLELGDSYAHLPPALESVSGADQFYWSDYGLVYGPIHKWTAEALLSIV